MEQPQRNVLAYLLKGGELTVQTALRKFHTTELRKIVCRLKRKGHDIRTRWVQDATAEGRQIRYKAYFLNFNAQ